MEMVEIEQLVKSVLSKTTLQSRDYQFRIIKKALDVYYNKNSKSVLIESACGSGKTPMLLLIIKCIQEIDKRVKVVWTTMRKKLLEQAAEENISKKILANVQFMSMFEKKPPMDVDIIVVDEAHHDSTRSMAHIYNVSKPKFILGGTGTPFRTDRVKLCFGTIIKDAGIGRLIAEGYLSPYHHYTIPDWEVDTVCDFYLGFPDCWGQTIMSFHNLKQCELAASKLIDCGIRAAVVSGNKDTYKHMDQFSEGELDVLVNCMMVTEGFNVCALRTVFCRPGCKSSTVQMCGRAFRKHPKIKYKNVVQAEKTKWPFIKTALPKMQWLWENDEWRSLTPNEDIIHAVHNSIRAISQANAALPDYIQKKHTQKRRSRRGEF